MWVVSALAPPGAVSEVAAGSFQGEVLLVSDAYDGRFGAWAIGDVGDARVLVELDSLEFERGDRLQVRGSLEEGPGTAAGRAYGGVLTIADLEERTPSRFLPHRAGAAVRRAVLRGLAPMNDARALLSGFLIGDISEISAADRDAMRKSGLAHFVAVSGSNVALFLAILGVVAGPLALGPKRRALLGLIGLPIYVAATRFEPSVLRASAMAALALGGRLAGVVLEAWQLLSLAIVILLLMEPGLTSNVGFQLSVAATAGVLVGARWPVSGKVARALAVTLGAQLAVAPLLLHHFGTVPLLSPAVNLVAGPLVAAATVVGVIGVAGAGFLVPVAATLADLVLGLARGAASWPQLGPVQVAVLVTVGVIVLVLPVLRPLLAPLAAIGLVILLLAPTAGLPPNSVVVLDVGQGDSILIHGGEGHYALVDGGPDPVALIDKIRRYGVRRLDIVVVTHVHADHTTGLTAVVGQIPIGEVWAVTDPHRSPAFDELAKAIAGAGLEIASPQPGHLHPLGDLTLTVEGPVRRYASPNDQSIVLTVTGERRSMLLAGDIETFAQTDLEGLTADVLKVPHQGAGTSDPDWLRSVGAGTSVISVGPNQFGHPVTWVVETLQQSGSQVLRTDEDGDVIIDLSSAGEQPADGRPTDDEDAKIGA